MENNPWMTEIKHASPKEIIFWCLFGIERETECLAIFSLRETFFSGKFFTRPMIFSDPGVTKNPPWRDKNQDFLCKKYLSIKNQSARIRAKSSRNERFSRNWFQVSRIFQNNKKTKTLQPIGFWPKFPLSTRIRQPRFYFLLDVGEML